MGESFKLHSQALIGYEDAIMAEHNNANTPHALATPHVSEVAAY